ncbi:hypothetical protein EST38_g12479, partial [Candolleomyces aberdarensis]
DHEHGPDIPLTIDLDLVRTLQQESSKIKSLSLVLGNFDRDLDGGLEAEIVNIFSEGEFSNLEDFLLEIIPNVVELLPTLKLDKVFKNRPPKLQRLEGIQIPPNLAHLRVRLGQEFSHRMREFFDAWKLAQKGVIEPEHVSIEKPVRRSAISKRLILAWKTTKSPDQLTPDFKQHSLPSVALTYISDSRLRLGSPMNDNMHPFVEPQDYQHKWSFGKVRVVEVMGPREGDEDWARQKIYRLGVHLWTTIATAPHLQLLYLNSRFEDEFKEMIITLGQCVFPALQYLIFSYVRCETTLRQISFDEFAASFVEYFNLNRATPLAFLGFRHCPEQPSQATLDALKEVAVRVVCRETQEWP